MSGEPFERGVQGRQAAGHEHDGAVNLGHDHLVLMRDKPHHHKHVIHTPSDRAQSARALVAALVPDVQRRKLPRDVRSLRRQEADD